MINTHRRAVLVIDVQRGLCEGEYASYDCDQVIARINLVTARARAAQALVVIVQHESENGLLARGSPGWQIAPTLSVTASDTLLAKTASDAFHHTELDSILKQNGITELVIGGMQSDFCVDTTIRRALALGYPVVLMADGHTTLDNQTLSARQIIDHHNETLSNLSSFGPVVRLELAQAIAFTD